MEKRGQMNLSFGMIFSIILIIIFLAFGFYAITKFLELQDSIQVEQFLSDVQDDVNTMWKSPQGSREVGYSLPSKIDSVCFFDYDEFENLKFTSERIISGGKINNIDIESISDRGNPLCIENIGGKVKMIISKNYGEMLITIGRKNEI
jgi:hypothetical protein